MQRRTRLVSRSRIPLPVDGHAIRTPSRQSAETGEATWWSDVSRRQPRTGPGSPTSPTSRPCRRDVLGVHHRRLRRLHRGPGGRGGLRIDLAPPGKCHLLPLVRSALGNGVPNGQHASGGQAPSPRRPTAATWLVTVGCLCRPPLQWWRAYSSLLPGARHPGCSRFPLGSGSHGTKHVSKIGGVPNCRSAPPAAA